MSSAHLKTGGGGVQIIENVIVFGKIEVEGSRHIDLVEQQGSSMLENARVLERLVIAFGNREDHNRQVFT